jgi:hypothetical protein
MIEITVFSITINNCELIIFYFQETEVYIKILCNNMQYGVSKNTKVWEWTVIPLILDKNEYLWPRKYTSYLSFFTL